MTYEQFENYVAYARDRQLRGVLTPTWGPPTLIGFEDVHSPVQLEIYWSELQQTVVSCIRTGSNYSLEKPQGMDAVLWWEDYTGHAISEEMGLELLLESNASRDYRLPPFTST